MEISDNTITQLMSVIGKDFNINDIFRANEAERTVFIQTDDELITIDKEDLDNKESYDLISILYNQLYNQIIINENDKSFVPCNGKLTYDIINTLLIKNNLNEEGFEFSLFKSSDYSSVWLVYFEDGWIPYLRIKYDIQNNLYQIDNFDYADYLICSKDLGIYKESDGKFTHPFM